MICFRISFFSIIINLYKFLSLFQPKIRKFASGKQNSSVINKKKLPVTGITEKTAKNLNPRNGKD
ncbi:hypothetical protein BA92_07425 [Sanguibacteroides justesenii]|uniref:Uncharacterized protein n=1 Tax=Sanguibacteroides justesenii TaxID=1547597 RepID=A0A0C3MEH9_9PORP|nr:hypothetical protein BA92_07425 [Sanguibacteroides justesenii]